MVEFSIAPDPADHDESTTDPNEVVIDLVEQDAATTIDLDDPAVNSLANEAQALLSPTETLVPGAVYSLSGLPLLFDSSGESLTSISDELFAVERDIVLVAKLPERRRDNPFEERDRFRWDTSLERIQLLNEYGSNEHGEQRTAHLFVESDRQPQHAVYIGLLHRAAFQTHPNSETAWFSIQPPVDADLHKLLKRGRIPQYQG